MVPQIHRDRMERPEQHHRRIEAAEELIDYTLRTHNLYSTYLALSGIDATSLNHFLIAVLFL